MNTQSPFSFVQRLAGSAAQMLGKLQAPVWLVEESRRRLVLLLNHVVMQEPQAQQRLARQQGRVLLAQWRQFNLRVLITPAGLFDLADEGRPPELTITVEEPSLLQMAQSAMKGDKPAVRIEGDVQLAADVNWLAEHLRWDVEEDLARIIGDVPAHTLAAGARSVADALKAVVNKLMPAAGRH